jgi:hypothetical protein
MTPKAPQQLKGKNKCKGKIGGGGNGKRVGNNDKGAENINNKGNFPCNF